jgi:peptidoglycan/xylan/chitin deacetylase (PgdA/CDA1 family)
MIEEMKGLPPAERKRVIERLAHSVAASPLKPASASMVDATMSWEQIEQMDTEEVVFGSHTQHHQILTQLSQHLVRSELADSRREIERQLRKKCQLFAYPNGSFTSETRSLVAEVGYELAFTTRRAAWTKECDPLLIPRVTVWEGMLTGPQGYFSPIAFEYGVFWKSYLGTKLGRHRSIPERRSFPKQKRPHSPLLDFPQSQSH